MPRIFSGRVIGYLLLLLVLDLSVLPFIRVGGIQPHLLYLIVLYAAFQWGWQRTLPMALAVGILRDLTGSHLLGLETGSLILASVILDLLVKKMVRESTLLRFSTALIFVFCASLFHLILVSFLSGTNYVSWHRCYLSLGTSLYTAACMPIFFYLTARWFYDRVPMKQYELFQ